MEFKKITIDDRETLEKYLSMQKHRACDYSVANLILWSDVYNIEYAVEKEMLFIKFVNDKETNFAYPMGKRDLKQAFDLLQSYCKEKNIEFKMNLIEPHMFEEIEKQYPGKYEVTYVRDNADYVYLVEDLKNLSGKKYHGKKNHINRFLKDNQDWNYETITDENTNECIDMVKAWCRENGCCDDPSKETEMCVLIKGLKYRKELKMIGGIIKIADKMIALTMGEAADEEMFIIHFEKAFANVNGAYPVINQQFIIHELSDYTYVNREEDMGIEGLRKAKESYRPAFMVEKGILLNKK